jgi:hypothetical protein
VCAGTREEGRENRKCLIVDVGEVGWIKKPQEVRGYSMDYVGVRIQFRN